MIWAIISITIRLAFLVVSLTLQIALRLGIALGQLAVIGIQYLRRQHTAKAATPPTHEPASKGSSPDSPIRGWKSRFCEIFRLASS